MDAAKDYFHGEQFDMPEIRISHPINGRIPSALGKKASELTDEEKTLFYQRMCFCFEIPSIVHDEYGNRLALSIGGVRKPAGNCDAEVRFQASDDERKINLHGKENHA